MIINNRSSSNNHHLRGEFDIQIIRGLPSCHGFPITNKYSRTPFHNFGSEMSWQSSSQSFQAYFRFSIRYISSNVDDCHEYHLVCHDAFIIHLLESGNCGGNKHINFQVQKCPYNHLHNNFSHISSLGAAKSPWKQSNAWASVRLALLGSKNPLEVLSTSIYVFFDFYSE